MLHSIKVHLQRTRITKNESTKKVKLVQVDTSFASCGKEQMYRESFVDFHKMTRDEVYRPTICKNCLSKHDAQVKEIMELKRKGYN
jgi:hypothetical protein